MLVLASASPRRRELIARLGVDYTFAVSGADERLCPTLRPEEYVIELSRRKAESVAARYPDDLILGVDTVVVLDGAILGKPRDKEDARRMLRALSGRSHEVCSGYTLRSHDKSVSRSVSTTVRFAPLSDREIDRYILSGEPMDKAGAYGIQGLGGLFVTGISGDYYNVVGLPLNDIYGALKTEFGVYS